MQIAAGSERAKECVYLCRFFCLRFPRETNFPLDKYEHHEQENRTSICARGLILCVCFLFPLFTPCMQRKKGLRIRCGVFFVSIVRNILILPEVELYSPRRKCIKKKTWADECTYSIFHNKLDSRPIKGCISGFYNISQTVVINMKCLLT